MHLWKWTLNLSLFLLAGTILTGSWITLVASIGWYLVSLDIFNEEVGL